MNAQEPLPFDAPEPEPLPIFDPRIDWFATALRWLVMLQDHDVRMTPDGPRAFKKRKP